MVWEGSGGVILLYSLSRSGDSWPAGIPPVHRVSVDGEYANSRPSNDLCFSSEALLRPPRSQATRIYRAAAEAFSLVGSKCWLGRCHASKNGLFRCWRCSGNHALHGGGKPLPALLLIDYQTESTHSRQGLAFGGLEAFD